MPISGQKNRWFRRKTGPNKIPVKDETFDPVVDPKEDDGSTDGGGKDSRPDDGNSDGKSKGSNSNDGSIEGSGKGSKLNVGSNDGKKKSPNPNVGSANGREEYSNPNDGSTDEGEKNPRGSDGGTIEDEDTEGITLTDDYSESKSFRTIEKIFHHKYIPVRPKDWWVKYLCCFIIIALLLWILYCLYIGCQCKNIVVNNQTTSQVIVPSTNVRHGSKTVMDKDANKSVNKTVVAKNNETAKTSKKNDENISSTSSSINKKLDDSKKILNKPLEETTKSNANIESSIKSSAVDTASKSKKEDKISVAKETFKARVLPEHINPKLVHISGGTVSYIGSDGKAYKREIKSLDVMPAEVTIKEYFYFANDNESDFPAFWDGGSEDIRINKANPYQSSCLDEECPIIGVSTVEIEKYINWLNNRTGEQYSLLNEAQWHYIASYKDLDEEVWYAKNSSGSAHSVLKKQPNDKGIYGSYGNVSEICKSNNVYLALGGAWNSNKDGLKIKEKVTKSNKSDSIGFRLIKIKNKKDK